MSGASSSYYGVVALNTGTGIGLYASTSGTYSASFAQDILIAGTSYGPSDRRWKKAIAPISGGLSTLLQLKGVTFEWIDPEAHGGQVGKQIGFIAQDVEAVFPNWVHTDKDGYKTLSVSQIEALEVESVRELNAKYEALRTKSEGQQTQIEKLQYQLDNQQAEIDEIKHGKDPISRGPGFGSGVLALFAAGFAGATGLMLKRMGMSLATVVGMVLAGRKKE